MHALAKFDRRIVVFYTHWFGKRVADGLAVFRLVKVKVTCHPTQISPSLA
jgi:hypothetical protein